MLTARCLILPSHGLVRAYSAAAIEKLVLNKPSLDVKGLVSSLETVIETCKIRELPETTISKISSLDKTYQDFKELQSSLNALLMEKNTIQRQITEILKNKGDVTQLRSSQIEQRAKEKLLSRELKAKDVELLRVLDLVPNAVDSSVQATEQIVQWLNPKDEYKANAQIQHDKIGVDLGIIDLKSAATVSGSSWYYLIGDGALLEQALVQYALRLARKHEFNTVLPPSIVRNEVADACGFKPRDQNNEEQTYQLKNGDLCLTGTAEIPLAGLAINKTFDESELPLRAVGLSRSYRAEAGARGKDTRGLYRVHEFTKVELFVWATEKQSESELEKLRAFQEELIGSLGLSAKVINMPFNDLGAPAYKKYDIEAWMPGREAFGEVTSASNCTDYQSRRLQTKYKRKNDGKSYFVHTLNGTAIAVPRVIVAIIENFYSAENNEIAIPKPLQGFMDDRTTIKAQRNPFK